MSAVCFHSQSIWLCSAKAPKPATNASAAERSVPRSRVTAAAQAPAAASAIAAGIAPSSPRPESTWKNSECSWPACWKSGRASRSIVSNVSAPLPCSGWAVNPSQASPHQRLRRFVESELR